MSEEALQIAEERREAKSMGERGRRTQLNVEFQRTARRDKKTFSSEQCKETGKNYMGKTRYLLKKIGDIKGIFHARMGMIKGRDGKDLTQVEEIQKRWQDYTELYKKDLQNPDNDNGVITQLELNILECEFKLVGLKMHHYQ